ncbi:hypothetical protein DPMN_059630 [Dreissena polymorpha]|uniref:Uncharacterized protein n=1 Tax=Dreissena polymorpha TaxID=45954 RepID=A0A9D4HF91_DREPO|nr:hypothetical protein DPMN_059630 [Dreissena polymorpha]
MNTKLVCFLVCAIVATIVHGATINDVKEARRFIFEKPCSERCANQGGGCYGIHGACDGVCYCYNSGYSYRCKHCDVE